MSVSIDLDDDLYLAAKTAAQTECRSVAQQIEYWARLGRTMAETPALAFTQLQRKLAGSTAMEQAYVVPSAVTDPAERRRRIGDALGKLAASGAFADIEDPVAWQHEQRRDRPLPGRDD